MAHRSTIEPAVLDLKFTTGGSGDKYIDIAKELSKVNRRLYRQGKTYYVAGATLTFAGNLDPAAHGQYVRIYAAPNSWIVHNAWKKAFAAWKGQQRLAINATSPNAQGTWADFKVYLDDHHSGGTALPVLDGDNAAFSTGEWIYSLMLDEADDNSLDEQTMHLVGPTVGSSAWGLVHEYQNSRTTVQTDDPSIPNEASSGMYAQIATDSNMVTDEVIQNMEADNDSPPYNATAYPGGDTNADCVHELAIGSTAGGLGATKGFQAPCGLIMIEASADVGVTLHLMPGNYRGVAATPMGQ